MREKVNQYLRSAVDMLCEKYPDAEENIADLVAAWGVSFALGLVCLGLEFDPTQDECDMLMEEATAGLLAAVRTAQRARLLSN